MIIVILIHLEIVLKLLSIFLFSKNLWVDNYKFKNNIMLHLIQHKY